MTEHCVRIVFPYGEANLDDLFGLEEALEQAISSAGVGEFDGNEIGQGEAVLYMYGPDADALLQAILPVLRASPLNARTSLGRR